MIGSKLRAANNLFWHYVRNFKLIASPFQCLGLFRDSTPFGYRAQLRYGGRRFFARKEDMSAVHEVLLDDAYGFLAEYLKAIPNKPVVLDLGANIGCFSLRVFAERPDARIVAVEAAVDTHAILAENVALHKDLDWRAVHAGVWEADGVLHLDRGDRPVLNQVAATGEGEAIPALTLASIKRLASLERVDLIKMDIEGAENFVIPASIDDLDVDVLVVEIHRSLGDCLPACKVLRSRFQHALVHDVILSENPVYMLSHEPMVVPGMSSVDIVEHLKAFVPPAARRGVA
jgi:FkbM family methyltransferase